MQKIKKSADEYNKEKKEPREIFKMDFSGYDIPTAFGLSLYLSLGLIMLVVVAIVFLKGKKNKFGFEPFKN